MLLKRIENDGVIKALYESSNIMASYYEPKEESLTIVFGTGVGYKYPNVSETDYAMFELADSQGRIFNKTIKKDDFQVLGEMDLDALRREMAASKQEEITKINKEIIEVASQIAEHPELFEQGLEDIVKLYNIRKEKIGGL